MLGASPCYWDWDTPNIYFISHVVVSYLLKTTICVYLCSNDALRVFSGCFGQLQGIRMYFQD